MGSVGGDACGIVVGGADGFAIGNSVGSVVTDRGMVTGGVVDRNVVVVEVGVKFEVLDDEVNALDLIADDLSVAWDHAIDSGEWVLWLPLPSPSWSRSWSRSQSGSRSGSGSWSGSWSLSGSWPK